MHPPRDLERPTTPARAWLLRAGVVLAVSVAVVLLGRTLGTRVPAFAAAVAEMGTAGRVVFVGGYALATLLGFPASVLTLAAGALFGLGAGIAIVFAGATIGASLAFLVSRYLLRGAVQRRLGNHPRFAAVDRAVAAEGRKVVFLLRLSPLVPFSLLNYALGLTRVTFTDFLVASVGMLPGTTLYVYYGKLAGDVATLAGGAAPPKTTGYYVLLVAGLLATVAVTTVVTRTARAALKDAAVEPGGAEAHD